MNPPTSVIELGGQSAFYSLELCKSLAAAAVPDSRSLRRAGLDERASDFPLAGLSSSDW